MNTVDLHRPILIRLGLICVVAVVGRMAVLKPAHASLGSARLNLWAQSEEAASMDSEAVRASAENAERILEVARRLETRLTAGDGVNWTVNQFERLAAVHAVRLLRMNPRGSPSLDNRAEDAPKVIADEYSLELAGTYSDIANYLSQLENTLGLVEIEGLRMNATEPDAVTASVDLLVYRLAPGQTLFEDTEEPGHAE